MDLLGSKLIAMVVVPGRVIGSKKKIKGVRTYGLGRHRKGGTFSTQVIHAEKTVGCQKNPGPHEFTRYVCSHMSEFQTFAGLLLWEETASPTPWIYDHTPHHKSK